MEKNLKIGFLTPEYPHPKTGGAGGIGTGIYNLCRGLIEEGHQPVVLLYGQSQDGYFEDGGIRFHQISNVRFKGISWLLTRLKIKKLIDRLHQSGNLDIVEAPDWTGISAFINTRCPIVVRLNGSDTYFCHLDKRPVKPFTRFLEKRALMQADGLISVSRYTASVTREIFGISREFTIIPNSVQAAKFTPEATSDLNTVLYFGTLIRKKGLLELPHIFNTVCKLNPDARLILAGRDSADKESGQASTWELMRPLFSPDALSRTSYIGPVEYDVISSHIARASVCVFPTFAEALPLSWLEAMAMGKAVVASDIGWAQEVIEDGVSGLLASPARHEDFAGRIVSLLDDDSVRIAMGKQARQRILEKFDHVLIARKSVAFYSKYI